MARPEVEVDEDQVEKLAAIMCSYEEMASVLDCSVSTLQRRFDQAIKRGRDKGKTSLKRKQYEIAMKGNVTMLIWLGKQHLGQRDKPEGETVIAGPTLVTADKDTLVAMVKELRAMKP